MFLNTGDVKPCHLGRPTESITLFPNEEYVVIDCVLRILIQYSMRLQILTPTPRVHRVVWKCFVV